MEAGDELKSTPSYIAATILCIVVSIAAFVLYLYFGKSREVKTWLVTKEQAEKVKAEIRRYGSKQEIILALRNKLTQLPLNKSNAKGWFILGKLYFNEKDFSQAFLAFKKAVDLNPEQPEYILQLVATNYYFHHQLNDNDKRLIDRLLKVSPNNVNAINLLAINDYQTQHYEQAIRRWESLLNYFPVDSADAKSLIEMIHQAQLQANQIQIKVAVSLLPLFKSKLSPNDTLFVYAVENQGPKIPLAVVKLAAQFPTTVLLSNATSMIPGKFLTKGKEIYIEARVSKTGNAMPTKSDLMGKSGKIFLDSNKIFVNIQINQTPKQKDSSKS